MYLYIKTNLLKTPLICHDFNGIKNSKVPENVRTRSAEKQMVSVNCKTVLANGTSQTNPKRNRVNSIEDNALRARSCVRACVCTR